MSDATINVLRWRGSIIQVCHLPSLSSLPINQKTKPSIGSELRKDWRVRQLKLGVASGRCSRRGYLGAPSTQCVSKKVVTVRIIDDARSRA